MPSLQLIVANPADFLTKQVKPGSVISICLRLVAQGLDCCEVSIEGTNTGFAVFGESRKEVGFSYQNGEAVVSLEWKVKVQSDCEITIWATGGQISQRAYLPIRIKGSQ